MANQVDTPSPNRLLRGVIVTVGLFLVFALMLMGQSRTSNVFASPLATQSASSSLRGIHLGNHYSGEDWSNGLLQRIDGDKAGGTWPSVVVVLSQHVYNLNRTGSLCRIQGVTPRNPNIVDYLERASLHNVRIIIRVRPSPGNFDAGYHLLATTASGCDADHLRSYDDIGDEIIKIHEWNANLSHRITEFGFEPASEPNIEWYRVDPNPTPIRLDDSRAWSEMDTYFSAVYDYVHAVYPSPTIRVLTPPMSQGAYAELKDVSNCTQKVLVGGGYGYEKMLNVFLTGAKNDGYDWHNYWKVGYEAWGDCDSNVSPYGQHVAFQFPSQMIFAMLAKPRTITEADVASPPAPLVYNGQFGNLGDKDELLGFTAANSLNQFFNAGDMAESIAVWSLNIMTPRIEPTTHAPEETNWHEAYRCNDVDQPNMTLLERPWFTWWWTGLPNLSLPYCYKSYEPVIIKPQPTPRNTPCLGC